MEMEEAIKEILKRSNFVGDAEKMHVLRVYTKGNGVLKKRWRDDSILQTSIPLADPPLTPALAWVWSAA